MPEYASILLIEDEAKLRHNLGLLLHQEGYHVVGVADGAQGINRLQEEPFDLVLTDVVMPEVDGFQIMEYVNAYVPHVVVVAMTAYVSTESAIEALRHGAYDYIVKPFDVDLMQAVIKRALEKARMQQAFQHSIGELEHQLEECTRRLTEAYSNLEQSDNALRSMQDQWHRMEELYALGEMTASLSRELDDSLTVILGSTQVLGRSVPTESPMKAGIEQLGELAYRCHETLQHLVDFSSATASKKIPTHLSAVCDDMLVRLYHQAELHRVMVERRLDANLPAIMVNPHQLLQALTAIALHGCRSMTSDDRPGHLAVETRGGDGVIQVVLQVDTLTATRGGGGLHQSLSIPRQSASPMGLGLAYAMIRRQGGRVAVHSIPGETDTYMIDFPCDEVVPPTRSRPLGGSEIMAHQRMLVVDAEEEYLVLLQEIIRDLGHDADGVASAQQALQRIAECNYDLIIVDTQLPGEGVAYFHQQLSALRPELARRMIFISSRLVSAEVMTFLASTDCPLIKKPFNVADIETGVLQALEGCKNPGPVADH